MPECLIKEEAWTEKLGVDTRASSAGPRGGEGTFQVGMFRSKAGTFCNQLEMWQKASVGR